MTQRRVLVAFSDDSLGGTSRSALTMGRAWRAVGVQVDFQPLKGVHPARIDEFLGVGRLLDAADAAQYDLLHHHHGHLNERDRAAFEHWRAAAAGAAVPPPLLTHNVFGTADHPLGRWPGPIAVGLLGEWLVRQYRFSSWPRMQAPVVVVPNPQDFGFFRPPAGSERAAARERWAPDDRPVVLRVGSPHPGKWSSSYIRLGQAAAERGVHLVCVGAPAGLSAALARRGSAELLPPSNDAVRLRQLYWAADVLALDARQGESFGNVLLEALGCGTPAVYRDRPAHDNTPREFPVLVSRGANRFVEDVLTVAEGDPRAPRPDPADLARYSIDGVTDLLRVLLDGRLSTAALEAAARPRRSMPLPDVLAVGLRHLPPGRSALAAYRATRSALRRDVPRSGGRSA